MKKKNDEGEMGNIDLFVCHISDRSVDTFSPFLSFKKRERERIFLLFVEENTTHQSIRILDNNKHRMHSGVMW